MAKRSLIDAALEGFQRLSGEFDPRYDPRVKEQERLRNLSLQVQERGTQDAPRIPLTDLEGRGFVTTMSDRTRAGGLLTGINDTELSYPVNLQGGQGYMFENPGQVWASAPGVVNQIMREAGRVRGNTGQEPAYIPFRMAPTGGDFAKKTGETMLSYASVSMNKKNKKSLDRSMKQFIPDWLGVDNPDSIAQYRAMSDKKRKAIKQMLDRDFRDKGGLNIGEARLAVSDPSQVSAKDAGVQNVGQIFTDRPTIVGSGHPSYPYGVPGEGLGTLNRDIGIFDLLPDVVRERGIPDPSAPRQTDIRALQMKPYSGVIDEVLLRDLEARGIDINSPAYAGLLAAITAGAMMAPEDAEANPLTRSIRAYHGSPYRFDEFKREAIGTGEGNQAYGYGLYFAEAEDVARSYKQAPEVLGGFDNFAMSEAADSYLYDLGESLRKSDPLLAGAISELRAGDFSPDIIKRKMKDLDDDFTAEEIEAAAARFDGVLQKINKDFSGSMYEVNLNVSPDDLIDWDKPISQQSDSVKKAIEASRQKLPPNAVDDLGGDLSLLYGKDVSVGDFLGNMQAIGGRADFGESVLGDLGVKGIRYKDQFSRGGEEGTNNYVIFDPRVIEISRTYSISIPQASELLAQQDRQREGLLSQIDPVEQRVQQLMQPLAQEPGYNYGDILPIKRSTDPARREEFPYGLEPAIPNMARGLLEEAVRAYEMNKAGRQREATQSALGLLF